LNIHDKNVLTVERVLLRHQENFIMTGLMPLLSPQQANEWISQKEAILIDVRSLTAYKALHIPNSLHAPHTDAIADLIIANPTERVILLCQNGTQAAQITSLLQQKPIPALDSILFYVLDGGLNGWRNAHLPVMRDTDIAMPIDRQMHIAVGIVLIMAGLFSWMFSSLWLILVLAIGAGLMTGGLTGWYGFQQLVLLFPWNRHD
jgi:rhodanese-related sulfurtransferase